MEVIFHTPGKLQKKSLYVLLNHKLVLSQNLWWASKTMVSHHNLVHSPIKTIPFLRVLQKHRQPAIFSVYSTLQRPLHVAITLVLFRWLAVSINREMALVWCELLCNADFYFCYVIKTLATLSSKCTDKNATALLRRTRARLPPAINLFPATSFFGRTLLSFFSFFLHFVPNVFKPLLSFSLRRGTLKPNGEQRNSTCLLMVHIGNRLPATSSQ